MTALSFVVFGSVPLLIFLLKGSIADSLGVHPQSPLAVSTMATAFTMFALGALSGTFTEQSVLKSGLLMAAHGLLAAYAAYAVGTAMESIYVDHAVAAGGMKADL